MRLRLLPASASERDRSRGGAVRRAAARALGSAEPPVEPLPAAVHAWATALRARVSEERLRADVESLARPRGRLCAPEAMRNAERHVVDALRRAGWETERQPFSFAGVTGYRDPPDEVPGDYRTTYEQLEGANVLARRDGTSGRRALLVGAHLDTVRTSPGADDNASGVAAVLELARVLAGSRFEDDVILAVFDMEELGGFGARAVASALATTEPLGGVIVFESIGYTSSEPGSQALPIGIAALFPEQVGRIRRRGNVGDWELVIFRRTSQPIACALADGLAAVAGRDAVVAVRDPVDLAVRPLLTRVAPWIGDFARSDHSEFWKLGVPAVMVTDTADFRNPNYHAGGDTPETLDYERIADVVAATAVAVDRLAGGRSEATAPSGAASEPVAGAV